MYHHVRLTLKPDKTKGYPTHAVEVDLSHDDMLAKIVVPFLKKETFFCGGAVVDPQKVSDVHFNATSQPSSELLPFIRAEHRAKGLFIASEIELVTEKGQDITRKALDDALEGLAKSTVNAPEQAGVSANRVFVVHGHDIAALDQTEILLRRWGLEPVILRDKANLGMTLIEKVQANTDVGYGIVLLTPDDLGGVDREHLSPRARQNVIFEWGYLVAKLGRDRVACLCKKGVEIPSDLHGIVRIEVGADVRDSSEDIRRELVAAGYHLREA